MKKITAIIIILCMAVTGTCTGIPEMIVTGDDMTAEAASYPSLKTISYKATGNQRKDIIGFAKTQVGYAEGSNNNTYFGSWFGCNYNPWCAMFVCWSARKAGVTKKVIPSLATADRSWAKKQGVYYKSKYWGGSYTPKKGDLIYFSWSVRDYADHIGMVTGTKKSGGTTYVKTIEGNKHDKVVQGSYAINNRYILGYASPKYKKGDAPEDSTKESAEKYTLKYRDGLDSTSDDEEDEIISPVKGTFGKDLILSDTKFSRKGFTYTKWKIYKENSSGKLIYLCRDTATQKTEKWYQADSIPEDFTQVYVKCGEALNISKSVSGTIYASPKWKKKTYTITYDANGGKNAPDAQKKTYNKDLTLTKEKPTRDGYDFAGWATSVSAEDPEYKGGETYKKNAKMTLYAIWEGDSFKVKTTASVKARSGPGKDYDKVSTIPSGTKLTIKKERNGWGQTKDKTWIALKYTLRLGMKEYQLVYNDGLSSTSNDSEIISPVTVSYGKAVATSETDYDREGHHYNEWQIYYLRNGKKTYLYSDEDSKAEKWYQKGKAPDTSKKTTVSKGDKLTISKSVGDKIYITPVWDLNTYKITYKANGGKNAPKAQTKTHGKTLTLKTKKPTRKGGYKFLGWSTNSSATKAQYKPGSKFKKDETTKLYAVWKANWFKVKTTEEVNKRKGPGTQYDVVGAIAKGKTVKIYKKKKGWGKLKSGYWISLDLTKKPKKSSSSKKKGVSAEDQEESDENKTDSEKDPVFTVKITSEEGLNARSGASKDFDVVTSYQYDEELRISEVKDGWGKLAEEEESEQWVLLEETKITEGYEVEVTSEELNQRKGPGTEYDAEGYIEPGTYAITRIKGDWGKVEATDTWIKLEFTKRVKNDSDEDDSDEADSTETTGTEESKTQSE